MIPSILDHLLDAELPTRTDVEIAAALVAALPPEHHRAYLERAIVAGCPAPDDADDAPLAGPGDGPHDGRPLSPDDDDVNVPGHEVIERLARRATIARPRWRVGRSRGPVPAPCVADLAEAARRARVDVVELVESVARVCDLGLDVAREDVALLDDLPDRWLLRALEGASDPEVRAAAARGYLASTRLRSRHEVRGAHVVDAIADAIGAATRGAIDDATRLEVTVLAYLGVLLAPVPALVQRWAERCLAWVPGVPAATWNGGLERLDGSVVPLLREGVARRFLRAVVGRALDEHDLEAATIALACLGHAPLDAAEIRLAEELAAAALRRRAEAARVEGLRAVLLEALASGAETRAAVTKLRDAPDQREPVWTRGRLCRWEAAERAMERAMRAGRRGRAR